MQNERKPSVFLTYWFQIQPERIDAFQVWAAKRGMPFWERHRGVVQYRTFRQCSERNIRANLAGIPAKIDGLSQVELIDDEALKSIVLTPEFQALQNELLQFIVPGSLKYSFLACAYDSSSLAGRLSKKLE